MILAEKITLLRKRNGWSQEELAEKLGVSRQSISKWESAQSMPDLNRILAMSELFDVSTDVLLKDDAQPDLPVPSFDVEPAGTAESIQTINGMNTASFSDPEPLRTVTMEEANDFLSLKVISAGRIAIGVMLCILSPIVLIMLSAAFEEGMLPMKENQVVGTGILILMLMIGTAVGLFVYYGMKLSRFEYIEKEALETAYGVEGMVRERMDRYNSTYTRSMIIGILLCVLSCVPIFIAMILDNGNFAMCIAVSLLLVMVAIGTTLIVHANIIMEAMKSLLEEGEYSRENKKENKRNGTIISLYWMLAAAIYLLISFLTKRWDSTWLVWPIAGIGCGILTAILRMVRSRE